MEFCRNPECDGVLKSLGHVSWEEQLAGLAEGWLYGCPKCDTLWDEHKGPTDVRRSLMKKCSISFSEFKKRRGLQ